VSFAVVVGVATVWAGHAAGTWIAVQRRAKPVIRLGVPVALALLAIAVTAFMMSPFVTAVEMPVIASPRPDWIATVNATPPSPPPPPRTTPPQVVAEGAPIVAPERIVPERPRQPPSDQPGVPGGVDIDVEAGGGSVLSTANVSERPVAPVAPPAPAGPLRIGGSIREPRKVVHVPPAYPEIARLARAEGTVILEALLDATGKVESVRVLKSMPLGLDDAAVTAVRQWRYTPTQLNGVPVPVLMTITVVFSLGR